MTTDLIKKLEGLTGPDRAMDGIIAEYFGYPQEAFGDRFGTTDVDGPEFHYDAATWSGNGKEWSSPFFTASVDAAIALAERVLPDYHYGILPGFFSDKPYAGIIGVKGKGIDLLDATIMGGSTPAIALCIAILKVKESQK